MPRPTGFDLELVNSKSDITMIHLTTQYSLTSDMWLTAALRQSAPWNWSSASSALELAVGAVSQTVQHTSWSQSWSGCGAVSAPEPNSGTYKVLPSLIELAVPFYLLFFSCHWLKWAPGHHHSTWSPFWFLQRNCFVVVVVVVVFRISIIN